MALLPIMSRLTSAGPQKVTRFLFVIEGNSYYPFTVRDPNTLALINANTTRPITDTSMLWYGSYEHKTPLIVQNTLFDQTYALPAIASSGLSDQTAVLYGMS